MKHVLLVGLILTASCATHHRTQSVTHVDIPPIADVTPVHVEIPPEVAPEWLTALAVYQKTKKAPVVKFEGRSYYPYKEGFTVNALFLRKVDIELQQGEWFKKDGALTDDQWEAKPMVSGSGDDQRQHLVLSPKEKGAETDILLYTNQGMYLLEAKEGRKGPTLVGLYRPQDIATRVHLRTEALAKQAALPPQPQQPQLTQTTYAISGTDVPWMPLTARDDGTRVYILLPESARTTTLPLLYVSDNGELELVNYSTQFPYLIIPQLFQKATLISGVGRQQAKVEIVRQ